MRHDSIEISYINPKSRTRRIWYGHGKSRLVANEPSRVVAPANVIDEAIADFVRHDAAKPATNAPHAQLNLLAADLSAQLNALDHQRNHLAQLLRDINNAPATQ